MSKRVNGLFAVAACVVFSRDLLGAVLTRTDGAGTWDFNTTKFTSSTGVNWTNNADTANFNLSGGGTGYLIAVDNSKGQVGAYGLTFGNVAGNWMFIGQPLQLGAGGIRQTLANATAGLTFSNTVELTAAQTWSINAARPIKAYGAVTGTGNLTFDTLNMGGSLTLSGANTYSGSLTAQNSGTLVLDYNLQNNNKLDPNGALTLGNTMTVQWSGGGSAFTQAVNGVTLAGPGDLYLNRSGQGNVLQMGALTRSAVGSTLRVSAAHIASTSAANQNGILGCWFATGAGWARNTTDGADGAIGETYGTADNNPGTGWTAAENVNHNAALSGSLTSRTINSLRLGGPSSLTLSGATLTLASGGLMACNANPTISNGYLQSGFASGELSVWTLNNNLTNNAVIQDNGATPTVLVKAGGNTLVLANANTYSGPTYVNQGTLQVNNGGTLGTNTLFVARGATASFNRADTFSLSQPLAGAGTIQHINSGTVSLTSSNNVFSGTIQNTSSGRLNLTLAGTNALGIVQNTGVGTLAVGAASGTSHNIGSLKNNAAGTVVINGAPDGTNTLGSYVGAAGGTLVVSNGVTFTGGQRNTAGNLSFAGGEFTVTADRLSLGADGQQLTITGGLLSLINTTYGLRLGTDNPAAYANGPSFTFTGSQSGGAVVNAQGRIDMGGVTAGKTISYDLSGGSMSLLGANAMALGAAPSAGSTTTFTLRGAGRLSVAGTIQGGSANDSTALQIFDFSGGTLAASAINATYLRASAAAAPGSFINAGGVLAPGDIGRPGKTTITGAYVVDAAAAQLAVDLGGTTAASAFQDTAAKYDLVNVNNGAAALGGGLRVSLVNGFVPAPGNTFDVLTSTGSGSGLSGSFINVSDGQVLASDGLTRFDVAVDTVNKRVRLSNAAVNQWASASGADWTAGASWTLAEPNGSDMAAVFGPALASSGMVTLDATRTVRGLTFTNGTSSYTVGGAGSLVLQGDAITAPQLRCLAGSHTVSVPVALAQDASVLVSGASDVLTLAGAVTGGEALTKTGAGKLTLSGNSTLGTVTVSGGSVELRNGVSSFDALSLAAGTSVSMASGSLTLQSGLALAGSAFFDLQRVGGTLLLRRGADGGMSDTVSEVLGAIAAGQILSDGQASAASKFWVVETQLSGEWYVSVTVRQLGTVISVQ